MPSLGEIFMSRGVGVISGVDVNGICVCVAVGVLLGVSVAVDGGGVGASLTGSKEKNKKEWDDFFHGLFVG